MKKMKRFAGGDTVEGDASVAEQMEKTPAKKQSFSEAFKGAEKGSTFEWEGKKYKKEYASDKKAESKPASKSEPAPSKPASKTAESNRSGIGPYNVFSGPADADPEAVKAAKAAGDARRAKQAAAPMLHNPFRGAIDALRERGKKSNPDAYAKGGSVSSASKRGDGIAQRGKTRGKMC
jgi:hypothetical protein